MKQSVRIGIGILLILISIQDLVAASAATWSNDSKFYIYWGYNRGWFSRSDIHFEGDGYSFELSDLKATDRQSEFTFKNYFYFEQWSVPQTNIKAGYFINDRLSVSLGFDHMKYVMVRDQNSNITGSIHVGNSTYDGDYQERPMQVTKDFLTFEHTNGLNYVFAEINRHDPLIERGKITVNSLLGISPALLRPRTDVYFLGQHGPNIFHNAGYGINAKAGLDIRFFHHLSLVTEVKAGWINMPWIRATANGHDRAAQHFGFFQANLQVGYVFGFKKNEKKP